MVSRCPPNRGNSTVAGAATDPDGASTRVDTILSQADASGGSQQRGSHINIPLAQGGSYSDAYGGLAAGRYRVRVTVVDNTGNAATQASQAMPHRTSTGVLHLGDARRANLHVARWTRVSRRQIRKALARARRRSAAAISARGGREWPRMAPCAARKR